MPKNNKKKQNKSKNTKKVTNASEELKQNETEKAVDVLDTLTDYLEDVDIKYNFKVETIDKKDDILLYIRKIRWGH